MNEFRPFWNPVAFFFCLGLIAATYACPPPEKLWPCSCVQRDDGVQHVLCSGLENDELLVRPIKALVGAQGPLALTIRDTKLSSLSHVSFRGVPLAELEFRGSPMPFLEGDDVSFEGLEGSLEVLVVAEAKHVGAWDFSWLEGLGKLRRLEMNGTDLEGIGDGIRDVSSRSVEHLCFDGNRISYVDDHAFANFAELRYLSLHRNLVKKVKRSMLPNPAGMLEYLNFESNEIESFPSDMFTNMPNLKHLFVGENKLLSLAEVTYSPVWEQLEHFSALGNRLVCDCRLSWMLKLKRPDNFSAVCDLPKLLRNRPLDRLQTWDLWCL